MLTAQRLGSNWHPRRLQAPRNPAHAAAAAAAAVGAAGHLKVLFIEFTGNFLSDWQPQNLQSTAAVGAGHHKISYYHLTLHRNLPGILCIC